MQRIVVVGPSGAGKSTLACELARRKGVPFVELDALHWKANWTPTPADEMRVVVAKAVAPEAWVVAGNYSMVRDVLWSRADTIIWLDYGFCVAFWRVLKRTFRRLIRHEDLWNGNRESWKSTFSRDSVLKWAITAYGKTRRTIPEALAQPEFAHLKVVHLHSPRRTRDWLRHIADEEIMGLKDELKEYYTVQELASLLRVTDAAIEKWEQGGEIVGDAFDTVTRFPRHEVEKFLNKRRRVQIRRAGLAGLGVLAAIGAGFAALKLRGSDKNAE